MSTKIYIAAPWSDRGSMEEIAKRFEAINCIVTHRWWEAESVPEEQRDNKFKRKMALLDQKGVEDADAVILINSSKSEGKAVEQGVALAKNIPIIAVGKRGEFCKNVFHYLDLYHWVDDVEKALIVMEFVGAILEKESYA